MGHFFCFITFAKIQILISAEGLKFQYNDEVTFSFPFIECSTNEDLLLIGPSGIGKTTLLHLLAGFIIPDQGKIMVAGTDINSLKNNEKDKFRANMVGIVYQDNYFINAIDLGQNLLLAQTIAGNKKDIEKINKLSSQLNIDHLLNKKPDELSRGELQRASIVRALVNSPKVLLTDEPTSSLDDDNCERVIKILKEQAQENGAALLIVTHDNRLKAQFKRTIEL